MKAIRRRRLVLLAIPLVLIAVIIFITTPTLADVGVHPVLPGGSSIEPEEDTPIQMASEHVAMSVKLATAEDNSILNLNPAAYGLNIKPVWYPAVAAVVADFTMHNPTSSTIDLVTWFPLASALDSVSWELNPDEIVPAIANFQVMQNDVPLEFTVSQQPNPKGADKPPLPWASFQVSYPPQSDTHLIVSYLLPLTQATKGSELLVYYIFQTGSGWAGPIGKAELVLSLPYRASPNTIARISPNQLELPYPFASPGAVIPETAVMTGTQAVWSWTNFEPTAQDNFAAWLVNPILWTELQDAIAATQADPASGSARIDLGMVYYELAVGTYTRPTVFNDRYRDPGIEAFNKAGQLWPENPIPHTGMALLALSQYVPAGDAPPDVIQFVTSQLEAARKLESEHPDLLGPDSISSSMVEDVLATYPFSTLTATEGFSASSTASAGKTQAAAAPPTAFATPTLVPSSTAALSASPSPQTAPATDASTPDAPDSLGRGWSLLVILSTLGSTVFIGLVILAISLVLNSRRRG